ncbi:hypothetical protein C2845_PM02G38170 [Panicum miliaceum]|uniref:Uncharacterized protein n=1 Tax=Panicum miliaceum TaxID=4540 RepID=A0A3L6S9S3_PANMI|nr:hypothetical protein C2845_PM02G38170 [Panicum miliaceum]
MTGSRDQTTLSPENLHGAMHGDQRLSSTSVPVGRPADPRRKDGHWRQAPTAAATGRSSRSMAVDQPLTGKELAGLEWSTTASTAPRANLPATARNRTGAPGNRQCRTSHGGQRAPHPRQRTRGCKPGRDASGCGSAPIRPGICRSGTYARGSVGEEQSQQLEAPNRRGEKEGKEERRKGEQAPLGPAAGRRPHCP